MGQFCKMFIGIAAGVGEIGAVVVIPKRVVKRCLDAIGLVLECVGTVYGDRVEIRPGSIEGYRLTIIVIIIDSYGRYPRMFG